MSGRIKICRAAAYLNHSLERIGEQLVMLAQTVPSETEVLRRPLVTSARLTLS